jgi:hypothetical protein
VDQGRSPAAEPSVQLGYPAPLKNALDFLYYEWHDKQAASVTYGTRGSNKGAAQFHGVLEGVHMRPLEGRIEIVITDEDVDEGLAGARPTRHASSIPTAGQADRRAVGRGADGHAMRSGTVARRTSDALT